MSDNLQLLLQEALNNNSYDYKSMHLALKKTWENSFSYLYELQHAQIEYEEHFYYSNDEISRNSRLLGDLHVDKLNRATFDVDYDLIRAYSREKYRTSEFYQKEIPIQKVIDYPQIFYKLPVVLIDDKVIWDYKVKISRDKTTFILPFKRDFVVEPYRSAGYYKENPNNPEEPIWVAGSRRGNTFTIDQDLFINGTDPSGDEVDLNYNFVPARVVKIRNMISDAIAEGKTILEIKDDLDLALFDYYTIDECTDDHITVTQISDDLIYKDHKVQVLVIDNIFYQRYTVTRRNFEFDDENSAIKINYDVFGDTIGRDFPGKKPGMFMLSFHLYNINRAGYELGSSLFPAENNEDHMYCQLSPEMYATLKEHNLTFYISVVFFYRLHEHKFWTGSTITRANNQLETNLCVIEKEPLHPYAMPIPVENFIVFKNPASYERDYQIIRNVDSLKMYYPNIYTIQDPDVQIGDEYRLFYFYYEGHDLHYTPVHHFYYEFLSDVFKDNTESRQIEEILDKLYHGKFDINQYFGPEVNTVKAFNDIFKKIINYKYYKHQYADVDFLHRYLDDPINSDKVPVEYKDETLRDWIKVEPFVLRDYVIEQKRRGVVYGLWTNTLDLQSRLRTDTSQEFDLPTHFDDERYVFAISNKLVYPKPLNVRVFVDGLFMMDLYQERKVFMDYIYIPAKYVTDDSYIEVELFQETETEEEYVFTSMDDVKRIRVMEPDKNITPTICDLSFVNTDDEYRYDKDFFDLTSVYEKMEVPIKAVAPDCPIRFTRLTDFTIKPNDEYVLNKPFKIRVAKTSLGTLHEVTKAGPQIFYLDVFNFGLYSDYIRIFYNDRILPRERYFINTLTSPATLYLPDVSFEPGDKIYVDVTPYRYRQVYYQSKLKEKEPVIDLKGYITKPFDIKYYDVYMNGRKLNQTNVWTVDPWSITLTNLHSIYNLVIFEKERDYEYFGLKYDDYDYYFSLEELFKQKFVTEDERNEILKRIIDGQKDPRTNIKPNTNDEDRMDYEDKTKWMRLYSYYHDELLPKTFYNPSEKQISSEVLEEVFPLINEKFRTSPFQETKDPYYKERRKNYPDVITHNPDIDVLLDPQLPREQLVYVIGQPGDLSEEILEQDVVIANKWLVE